MPKTAVGVVIGKGGEMIKKIQGETGCKLQFIQGKGDGPGDRRCIISGTKQQVEDAKRTIEDLIESVMVILHHHYYSTYCTFLIYIAECNFICACDIYLLCFYFLHNSAKQPK